MIKLRYNLNGENITKDLTEGNYIIGRSKNCDIVIRDPSISGQHIRIDVTAEEISFRDLLSRNGTVLNGKKVTQGHLGNGDTLRLGNMYVSIEDSSPALSSFDMPPPPQASGDEFDLAPAPAPASEGGEYALAEYESEPANSVEVFRAPVSPVGGGVVQPPAPVEKKRLPILIGMLAVIFGLVAWVYLKDMGKSADAARVRNRISPEDKYWKEMVNGSEDFRLGNYKASIAIWKKGEESYEKASGNRMRVGKLFVQVAQPYYDSKIGSAIDPSTDWNDLRLKLLQLVDSNILTIELRDFAIDLEKGLRKEIKAKGYFSEANNLMLDHKWEEAIAAYNKVSPDSLYYPSVNRMISKVNEDRLVAIKLEAESAAKSGNYSLAIKRAEEFFGHNGKDMVLAEKLNSWRDKQYIQVELRKVRKLSHESVSAAEIDSARLIAKSLSQRFPDDPDVLAEIPGILSDLNARHFVVQMGTLYRNGDTVGRDKLLQNNAHYKDNAVVKDILRRWAEMEKEKGIADKIENDGDIESALKHWNVMLLTEKDPDNRYREYAVTKLKQYPPEVMGQMMMEASVKAMNRENYRLSRALLEKAKNYGVDVKNALGALHKTGNILFNKGVQSYINKEYSMAHKLVNDGRDCFSPEDDFYGRIDAWMRKNNIAVRKVNQE